MSPLRGEHYRSIPRRNRFLRPAPDALIGFRFKEAAEALKIALRNIYEKLHVRSRAEAVAKFLRKRRATALSV